MRKIQVGRSESNTYCIPDGTVSRNHAELIFHSSESIELVDLGSKYGTYVIRNDEAQKIETMMLHPEDVIVFGKSAPLTIQEIVATILDSTKADFTGCPLIEEAVSNEIKTDPAAKASEQEQPKAQPKPRQEAAKATKPLAKKAPVKKPLKAKPKKPAINPQVQSAPNTNNAFEIKQSQIETQVARMRCRHCKSVVLSTWTHCPYCEGRI
jgi:hypothetical protein